MNTRTMDFYVEESEKIDGGLRLKTRPRYQLSIHWSEEKRPRGTSVTVVRSRGSSNAGAGLALCAPDDTFDIRVGVPLALKRALHQIPNSNRPAVMREFFRQWPEAHPEYKRAVTYTLKAGDPVTRLTIERGGIVPDGMKDRIFNTETGEVLKVTKVETVPYIPNRLLHSDGDGGHEVECGCGNVHKCL
jgi:hypothetical protein